MNVQILLDRMVPKKKLVDDMWKKKEKYSRLVQCKTRGNKSKRPILFFYNIMGGSGCKKIADSCHAATRPGRLVRVNVTRYN